ncbi:MAG: hypothetical protein V3S49_02230 [Thermodesulfobacteriota bacterium]
MSQDKLCPECNAEYLHHIVDCPACGVPLVLPEELEEIQERQRQFAEEDIKNAVAIKEGGKRWILELRDLLINKGFPCTITISQSCPPGQCDESFLLVVPKEAAESAANCMAEYIHKVHPEIKESEELAAQGRCPACGSDAGVAATECPDCGLLLMIESE